MEATKVKPATALPWDYASIENSILPGAVLVDSEGDCICRVPLDKIDDTIYIAHAANAYPKLVEALRHYADAWDGKAAEVLRSLGESA